MAWMPTSPNLTAETFWAQVAAHPVVVVRFWAEWNLVDQQVDKALQKVRPEFSEIKFFAFDTSPEVNWDIARQLAIYSLPALLCFLNGKHHDTYVGYLPPDQLRAKLREWLAAST